MPIRLPLICAIQDDVQVEVVFRQPITCAVLGFSMADTDIKYERFHHGVGRFVSHPRPHEKLYIVRGEHLVYRAKDVVDCPGAKDLAAGRPFQPQLPAFLDHLRAQQTPSKGGVARGSRTASSASPALSSTSVLADDFDVSIASPARVLRSGLILPDNDSPSSSRTLTSTSTNTQRVNVDAAEKFVSVGVKRKRSEPMVQAPKRVRRRGRSPEAGDFGEVWEICYDDCMMSWDS